MKRNSIVKRIVSFILLAVMGINCFGGSIPHGVKTVYATQYEETTTETNEVTEEQSIAEEIEEIPEEIEETTSYSVEEEVYEAMTISSNTTLKEDIEVGNLTINAPLYVNGHKIVVHGDVILNSTLYMEEGYLEIEGNYKEEYWAVLAMNSANDYIFIQNDFIYNDSYYEWKRYINNGVIEIMGNIYGSSGNYCNKEVIFGEECKILLTGTEKQEIDIRTDSLYLFQNIVVENTSAEGVFSKHLLRSNKITDENKKLAYSLDGEIGETLSEDKIIEGNYTLLGGKLDLAGYNLTIKGDFIHAAGTVDIHGGTLIVEGDYRKQAVCSDGEKTIYEQSIGRLLMTNESDYVLINGNYIDSGLYSTEGELTNGIFELKGSMMADDHINHNCFIATKNHTFKLTGNKKQIMNAGKQHTGDYLRFANFIVEQGEDGSTELQSDIWVSASVEHKSSNISGTTRILI